MSFLPRLNLLLLPLTFCLLVGIPRQISAQVVRDRTLPTDSHVRSEGNTVEITGGTRAGRNLFHSFEQFSVPSGQTALFNNATAVENIIGRVTGRSSSRIDGLIQANGSANLFLLNPNGIIFGPNAALNIGGSFIGSTANSLKFADGVEFSAVSPQPSTLLTVSVPAGLQSGTNPRPIRVQGNGHNLFLNSPADQSVNRDSRPNGLRVNSGQTLALIGGDISLEGGNLTASSGRIALGSVADGEQVTLAPDDLGWDLNYDTVERFQDIQLSQAASLEASGNRGGQIQVQGHNVTITETSAMLADTLGNGVGGRLAIRAIDTVRVSDASRPLDNPFISRLSTDVAPNATGQGGDLTIAAERLQVTNGAQISSGTFSSGNAGSLTVQAKDLIINGESRIGPSGLFTPVEATASGNGGALTLITERLQITNGGQVAASTFGQGDAGTLGVRANDIELQGDFSGLFANVETNASGDGGNLSIVTERLRIVDGAQIGTLTFGSGNAGALSVEASDIAVIGTSRRLSSGLLATVEAGATGRGGNLTINTDRLLLSDGGQISTATFGNGNAGDLFVQAEDIEVRSGALEGPSSLVTASFSQGSGGNLEIKTDRLRLLDGGQIATATSGSGDAGDLTIEATERVELVGTTKFGDSGLFASAINDRGAGGDLSITTDRLEIRDSATISVSNFSSRDTDIPPGQGAVGNLTINANDISLDNRSLLTANSAAGDQGNISLRSSTVLLRQGSAITTNAQGDATGGNISIDTVILAALDNSDITANAEQNFGGQVTIDAQSVVGTETRQQLTSESDITASSDRGPQFSGTVQLNFSEVDSNQGAVELPSTVINSSTQVAAVCSETQGSEFIVTGRGGLPESPIEILRGGAIWEDFRSTGRRNQSVETENAAPPSNPARLSIAPSEFPPIEAQGWIVNAEGQVALVSTALSQEQTWLLCAADSVDPADPADAVGLVEDPSLEK